MKKLLTLVILAFVLLSCENKTDKQKSTPTQKSAKKDTISISENSHKDKNTKVFKDTFVFEDYNDNGDYMLLNAKKGKNFYGFINDNNDNRSLLRGDICEIQWKKDTIYIAGDGETPEIADWLVSIQKIKDGNVSKFRKEYKKEIKYHWFEENNYAQNYLDELYLLAEYYIANSNNKLLKSAIQNKDQLEYSIEKRTENNIDYEVFGIGYTFEHRFSIMQWIYIDRETKQIYEYDLPNEKLVAFE